MTNQSNSIEKYNANNDPLCIAEGADQQDMPFDRMLQINHTALQSNDEPIYLEILGNKETRGLVNPNTNRRICAIFGLRLGRIGFKTVEYKDYADQEKINVYCYQESTGKSYCFTAGSNSWWARSLMTGLSAMVQQGLIQETFNLSTVPGPKTCMFANLSIGDNKPFDYNVNEFWKSNKVSFKAPEDEKAANAAVINGEIKRISELVNNAIAGIQTAQVSDATPLAITGGEDDNDMPLEFLEDEQAQPAPAA